MKKTFVIYVVLIVLLVLSILLSLGMGAMAIAPGEVMRIILYKLGIVSVSEIDPMNEQVFSIIRMPRVVLGMLVGAALGISGAAIQGIFRNPLAEPGLIGVSSGASLFAVAVIVLETVLLQYIPSGIGYYSLYLAAFAGGALATWLVYSLSKNEGKPNIATMLLAGIAINAFAGALTGLLTFIADDQKLRTITFWMLGSLGGSDWEMVYTLLPFVLIPMCVLPFMGTSLNLFALGENQVELNGVNPTRVKILVVTLVAMSIGASVAVSGIIGFVGLLVPHCMRLWGGVDYRFVLTTSALGGAAVLTLSDLISRTLISPLELPIGVITALIGTPFFVYILIKDKKKVLS